MTSGSTTAERLQDAAPRLACPICGGPNACGPAARGRLDTPCWCTDAIFSAECLARVPASERCAACICATCAAASAATGQREPA